MAECVVPQIPAQDRTGDHGENGFGDQIWETKPGNPSSPGTGRSSEPVRHWEELRLLALAMRVLLVTVGSAGDVHPFVGIALALRQRGHAVSIATNPYFGPLMERLGLPLRPIGTVEDFERAISHPGLWRPFRGFEVIATLVQRSIPNVYKGNYTILTKATNLHFIAIGYRRLDSRPVRWM